MEVKEGRMKREKDPQVQSPLKALSGPRPLHPAKVTRAMPEGKKMRGVGEEALTLCQRWNMKKNEPRFLWGIYPAPHQRGRLYKPQHNTAEKHDDLTR